MALTPVSSPIPESLYPLLAFTLIIGGLVAIISFFMYVFVWCYMEEFAKWSTQLRQGDCKLSVALFGHS